MKYNLPGRYSVPLTLHVHDVVEGIPVVVLYIRLGSVVRTYEVVEEPVWMFSTVVMLVVKLVSGSVVGFGGKCEVGGRVFVSDFMEVASVRLVV